MALKCSPGSGQSVIVQATQTAHVYRRGWQNVSIYCIHLTVANL